MAQQTAVEWLQVKLANIDNKSLGKYMFLFKQAKAMEKEQIINACEHFAEYPFEMNDYFQYYDETYVK